MKTKTESPIMIFLAVIFMACIIGIGLLAKPPKLEKFIEDHTGWEQKKK